MTTLSNNHANDSSQKEAWSEKTFAIGAVTALTIAAILVFASTA